MGRPPEIHYDSIIMVSLGAGFCAQFNGIQGLWAFYLNVSYSISQDLSCSYTIFGDFKFFGKKWKHKYKSDWILGKVF